MKISVFLEASITEYGADGSNFLDLLGALLNASQTGYD